MDGCLINCSIVAL